MSKYRRKKRRKNIIILSVVGIICMLGVGYAAFSTNFVVSGTGKIIERSRMIQSWTSSSNEDFHTDFYRENIISATFLDSNAIPSNAAKSWDVSVDKDGGVMAYVVESSTENGKYDLFIGANDGVIANEDSSCFFYNFSNLKTIDFKTNFDTSNTTDASQMFRNCGSLINLKLESLNTENILYMNRMFCGCSSLKELNLSNFDTSKVVNMQDMFSYSGFRTLDLKSFNTENVTNMQGMFYECTMLNEVNLESFNTSNVTRMYGLFYNCQNIKELNLCSFDTSKVTSLNEAFKFTTSLMAVYVGNGWNTDNAEVTNMFQNSNISSVTTGECPQTN